MEQLWEIQILDPFELSINFVAPAIGVDLQKYVVKFSFPDQGFKDEINALKLFPDTHSVRLINTDENRGVMLLEHILPGYSMRSMKEEQYCNIVAEVSANIHLPAPKSSFLPSTRARLHSLEHIERNHPSGIGPISKAQLQNAKLVFSYLYHSTETSYILHGDLHHDNIIKGERDWKAIDPKGLIGEKEYDFIPFLLNELPEEGYERVIENRAMTLCDVLRLDYRRMLLWGYAHAVLATSWSVSDNGYETSFYQSIHVFQTLAEFELNSSIEKFIK
ncbi:aminoglycoside phosphotransferase family protein [Halalkalibacillus halophilus]|uniref:aminoglycoside phosphotransferase family protein n=1 Tax=Halalkalibacillus halophilus TaxID=392827 RepID=UPI0012EB966A|nr:aminoglycoside phosphotransferase family protein [Halalkalibacillus halophilus]